MEFSRTNQALLVGRIQEPGILPKLDQLKQEPIVLSYSFGLDQLPTEPGILLIRGARQYGKSTWLQQMIWKTVEDFGPGSAFFLNGDEIKDYNFLMKEIRHLLPMYLKSSPVKRLFIDEITAIKDWEKALKILADQGELKEILVITTGSKAADLRHGSERLPGRKGRLARTNYIFTPISFTAFFQAWKAGKDDPQLPEEHIIPAYLLSGGSPQVCTELLGSQRISESSIEQVRDWVYGSFAEEKRSRASLLGVLECLHRFACSPIGQAKLAREAGLANNTIAAGYLETLMDLLAVATSFPWEIERNRPNRRRPCKFPYTNLLVATAWHPKRPRSPHDFLALDPQNQGEMLEWLVTQECFRHACIRGDEIPESFAHLKTKKHEVDFVFSSESFLEVKRGPVNPLEFSWFPLACPQGHLSVICENRFETQQITGVTLADFLTQVP